MHIFFQCEVEEECLGGGGCGGKEITEKHKERKDQENMIARKNLTPNVMLKMKKFGAKGSDVMLGGILEIFLYACIPVRKLVRVCLFVLLSACVSNIWFYE